MHYLLNVISRRVTLNLKLRQGPHRGMRYKPEVRVSLREYSILSWLENCPYFFLLIFPTNIAILPLLRYVLSCVLTLVRKCVAQYEDQSSSNGYTDVIHVLPAA